MGIRLIEGNAEDKGYNLANNIHITFRELQTLLLLARGEEHTDIAKDLNISVSTVRGHIYNAINKLGARNRSHVIVKAIENGMFEITANKDLVGYKPDEYCWCWKCGKVFTVNEMVEEPNEPIEINHMIVDVPPDEVCPYCNAYFDDSCYWNNLLKYNPNLPSTPDKSKVYPNLDFVNSYYEVEQYNED